MTSVSDYRGHLLKIIFRIEYPNKTIFKEEIIRHPGQRDFLYDLLVGKSHEYLSAKTSIVSCESVTDSSGLQIEEPKNSDRRSSNPPAIAEFILSALAPKRTRSGLIGCLATDYARYLKNGGKARADRLYYGAVIRSLWPQAQYALSRVGWAAIGSTLGRWWSS